MRLCELYQKTMDRLRGKTEESSSAQKNTGGGIGYDRESKEYSSV